MWDVSTAADFQAAFELIAEEVRRRTYLAPEAVDELSLGVARHLSGNKPLRLMLIGDAATGKTHVARSVAEAIGAPLIRIPLELMAEQNWHGPELSDWLNGIPAGAILPPTKAVILLDNFDTLKINRSRYYSGSGVTADYHKGKQESLLALWDGDDLPAEFNNLKARDLLVIGAGVFQGLTGDRLGHAELVAWGLENSLAHRVAASRMLRLREPEGDQLVAVLADMLRTDLKALDAIGCGLSVSPEAVRFVARTVVHREGEARLLQAHSWLIEAIERKLIQVLKRPAGTTAPIIAPDDVLVPETSSPRWLE